MDVTRKVRYWGTSRTECAPRVQIRLRTAATGGVDTIQQISSTRDRLGVLLHPRGKY